MSIIVLPTKCIRDSSIPSRAQVLDRLVGVEKRSSDRWSVTIRLVSSGIVAVEAPKARFEMGDRDPELRGAQGRAEGRVDVAGHDDEVGALLG